MKKIETINYRRSFSTAEIAILNDYLDTSIGKRDNTVTSYIKVNIEKFISFIQSKKDSYMKDLECSEAVETLMESLNVYKNKSLNFIGFK